MKCRSEYRHQVAVQEVTQTEITGHHIVTEYIKLLPSGLLFIKKGYAWDGATFFPDIKSIMTASLIHDALYQLMREKLLPQSKREAADIELIKICKKKGMLAPVRWAVYKAVRIFAASAASEKNVKEILEF